MNRPLTLMDRLRGLTVHRGDQRAAFDAEGTLTYRGLVEGMDAVAAGLRAAGVAPGDAAVHRATT